MAVSLVGTVSAGRVDGAITARGEEMPVHRPAEVGAAVRGSRRGSADRSGAVQPVEQQSSRGLLRSAPWRFLPADGVAHFEERGWAAERIEPIFPAAVALGRFDTPQAHRLAAGPQPDPRDPGDAPFSAVVTLRPAELGS